MKVNEDGNGKWEMGNGKWEMGNGGPGEDQLDILRGIGSVE